MNERVVIKGEFAKNRLAITYLVLAALFFIATIAMGIRVYNLEMEFLSAEYVPSLMYYLTTGSLNGGWWYGLGYLFALLFAILGVYTWLKLSLCELNVSDKRVWGKTSFSHQVDLPMRQISAIAYGKRGSIRIATSSGSINFWYLKNKDAVYNAISTELANLQQGTAPVPANSTDELKKYKELLDSGVITQEEFNAKKKQILGL